MDLFKMLSENHIRQKNINRQYNNKINKQKTATNMIDINSIISITLNINDQNTIKWRDQQSKKQDKLCHLQETHFKYKFIY